MEINKAPEMMDNLERRIIIWDSDIIEVQSEEYIDVDNNNLPAPDNLPVECQQEAPQSIFEDDYVQI